ncbi:MAG: DoxX family protein [Gammaproteobacteria bacterium]
MQTATALAQALSILAFGWYGALTLLSADMVAEFERYGLGRMRVFTATLQILGSVGLVAGYYSRPLLLLSAGGFTVMMLLAVLVRVRIRDPLVAAVPAFVLLCLNLFLVVRAIA